MANLSSSDINEWFQEYVYGWMCSDIRKTIDNGANYLAALGIAVYSEAIISLLHPKLKASEKYEIFVTQYLGEDYAKVNALMASTTTPDGKRGSIYNIVRCGLAHEYLIKGNGYVFQSAARAQTRKSLIQVDLLAVTSSFLCTANKGSPSRGMTMPANRFRSVIVEMRALEV